MKPRKHALRFAVAGAVVGLLGVVLPTGGAGAGAIPERPAIHRVVVRGLDNPRGIDPGPFGTLLLAEAGKGGTDDCQEGVDPFSGEPQTLCLGNTGKIDLLVGNHKVTLASLPSVANTEGTDASGPTHAALGPRGLLVSMTDHQPLPFDGDVSKFQKLLRLGFNGVETVADLAAFEAAENPDGAQIESNPYGLVPTRRGAVMTDAAGNSLVEVDGRGDVSLLAVFPSQMADAPDFLGLPPGTKIPAESVPTSVAKGPDGAWYVGELTGFPFQNNLARIWRVVPGEAPEVFARGFTNIIDLQFDRHGRLYVLEIAHTGLLSGDPHGALIRINGDGSRTRIGGSGLIVPGGVAVDARDRVFVTTHSTEAGAGQVVQIR